MREGRSEAPYLPNLTTGEGGFKTELVGLPRLCNSQVGHTAAFLSLINYYKYQVSIRWWWAALQGMVKARTTCRSRHCTAAESVLCPTKSYISISTLLELSLCVLCSGYSLIVVSSYL